MTKQLGDFYNKRAEHQFSVGSLGQKGSAWHGSLDGVTAPTEIFLAFVPANANATVTYTDLNTGVTWTNKEVAVGVVVVGKFAEISTDADLILYYGEFV